MSAGGVQWSSAPKIASVGQGSAAIASGAPWPGPRYASGTRIIP